MKAEIDAKGMLHIEGENSTETYALRHWAGQNLVKVDGGAALFKSIRIAGIPTNGTKEPPSVCGHVHKRSCPVCGPYLGWLDLQNLGRVPTHEEWQKACSEWQERHNANLK